MGKVMRALEVMAQGVQEGDPIKTGLLELPQALGWIGFKDWAIQVHLMAKTTSGKQWGVMMALRAEGVRVALPAQHIHLEERMPE